MKRSVAVAAVIGALAGAQPSEAITRDTVIDAAIGHAIALSVDLAGELGDGADVTSDVYGCRLTSRKRGSCQVWVQQTNGKPPVCRATVAVKQTGPSVWSELRQKRCSVVALDW